MKSITLWVKLFCQIRAVGQPQHTEEQAITVSLRLSNVKSAFSEQHATKRDWSKHQNPEGKYHQAEFGPLHATCLPQLMHLIALLGSFASSSGFQQSVHFTNCRASTEFCGSRLFQTLNTSATLVTLWVICLYHVRLIFICCKSIWSQNRVCCLRCSIALLIRLVMRFHLLLGFRVIHLQHSVGVHRLALIRILSDV